MGALIRSAIVIILIAILLVVIPPSTVLSDENGGEPLPSVVLIEQAYRSGKIDYDTAIQYKVSSIFDPQALPAEYQSTTPAKCATPILLEVNANWKTLKRETRDNLSAYPVGRPGSALLRPSLSGEVTYSTTHFQIHYTTSGGDAVDTTDVSPSNGIPDYIENMGTELENVWTKELSNMGWLQPPSDVSEDGNSDSDVYVIDMAAYGYAQGDGYADQGTATGDNENSAGVTEVNAVYGHIVLENDYAGFPLTPMDCVRVTAAHEFNHAIQFGYDIWEEAWLMEATATWMEDEVYDSINDNLQYLTYYFNYPDVAMPNEDPGLLHWYADWIFPRYISEHHGGQSTIRSIWENSVNYDSWYGYYSFNAVQDALSSAGTSLTAVFSNFTVANYVMSTSPTNNPYCYEEASSYPSVYIEGNINFSGSVVNYTPSDGIGNYAADYITISSTTDLIKITVSGASSSITYAARVIGMQSGVPTVTDIPLSGSPDSGSITLSTASYDTVILVVLNETPDSSSLTLSNYSVQVVDGTPPTMEAIVEAEGGYYNTAPVLSNFGFDDNEALDDGWYQMDSYTGTWLTLFTDNGTASWDNDGWTVPGFGGLSEGSHTVYFKASDDVGNLEGESGEWSWQFYKDTTPPTMEAIVEAEGQYYNVAPVLSNFGFDDNEALDDGWYQMDSYTGTWIALFTDVFDTDVSDLAVASDNLTIYATDRQRDKLYRSTDAGVSWTELTNPTGATEPQLIAVTPDDADFAAIVADDNEVYISDDGGTTWDTLDLELADAAITVQDLDISAAFDGNHYVAVAGDDGTDAKVYYYEIGAIGADWELISVAATYSGWADGDNAPAVAFSPNFASDEVMVAVSANFTDAIYFQVFCFYQETWNDEVGGFSSDYPLAIASDDGITSLDSASISLAPDYHAVWDTRRKVFVGLTVAGDADAIATSGIYRLDDDDLEALKTGEQIHSIAYNGTNLVAGEYDTTVVWRSTNPLAVTPTVSSSLSSPGGDDKVMVAWAGSDVVAGTSGNESAFTVSTDNGENFTDISLDGTSWDSDNWTIPGFGALSEDSYTIYFSASDNATNVEGESGEWSWQFFATDLPVLRDGAVSPTSGYTSANFTFSVTYADAENDAPDYITISIDGGASENMTVKAGQDSDYTNGEIYEYWILGSSLGVGSHTFQIFANDGTDDAIGDIGLHTGPTVSSPPAPPAGGGGGGGGGGGLPGVTSVGGEHTGKGKFEWDVTCESEDKCVELFIPEGTIGKGPNDTFLRVIKIFETEVLPPIPEHTNYIGLVYNFHYEGTTFNPPVDLTIRHDESLIPEEIDENSLIIATWDKYASEWIELESTVDTEKNTVTTKIDHFTKFTILAHTRPANFTVTNLSIAPKEIDLGESATVSVTVTNTGDLAGICELCLKKDDAIAQTKEITLTGGSSEKVTFSVTRDTAGECCVDVNGLIGSFVIKEEAPVVEEEIEPTPEPAAIPVPETIPIPTPKPPFNWGLLVGILAGVVAIGSVAYYVVRKRIKAKGSG